MPGQHLLALQASQWSASQTLCSSGVLCAKASPRGSPVAPRARLLQQSSTAAASRARLGRILLSCTLRLQAKRRLVRQVAWEGCKMLRHGGEDTRRRPT